MKRCNKKGFTIVELVIVIAVIAILAAVLIPTIAGLVRKANISADTVVAKELNSAIAQAAAEDEVDTFEDALAALKAHGYLIANLNAKADECYFVWDDANNQIILVDAKNGYEVLYSNKTASATKSDWYFAISDPAKVETVIAAGYVNAKNTVATVEDLKAALAAGGEFYMDESLVLDNDNTIKVAENSSANVVINLGDSTINTNGTLNTVPVYVGAGTLTINGGSIGGSGKYTNVYGPSASTISLDNALNAENGTIKLILNKVNVTSVHKAVSGCSNTDGDIRVDINDSTLTSDGYAVVLSCGGKGGVATLNNTNTSAAVNFFASQGSKIVVNGGTHISNGKVTSDNLSNAIFYLQKDSYGVASIEVTDGVFTCNGETKTFDELCTGTEDEVVSNWKALCWKGDTNVDVTVSDGKVTLTAK